MNNNKLPSGLGWFHGKDCCSLAVIIGAGMNLHPILLHSTRRIDKLGLLSLDKYVLSRVMGLLCVEQVGWQAIRPSSRASKERFRRSTPTPAPPVPSPIMLDA